MNDTPHKIAWHYRPVFLILLLIALGPFALPWLFKSPAFHPSMKVILTILVLIVTVWAVVITYDTVKVIWKHFQDLQLL